MSDTLPEIRKLDESVINRIAAGEVSGPTLDVTAPSLSTTEIICTKLSKDSTAFLILRYSHTEWVSLVMVWREPTMQTRVS